MPIRRIVFVKVWTLRASLKACIAFARLSPHCHLPPVHLIPIPREQWCWIISGLCIYVDVFSTMVFGSLCTQASHLLSLLYMRRYIVDYLVVYAIRGLSTYDYTYWNQGECSCGTEYNSLLSTWEFESPLASLTGQFPNSCLRRSH